MTRSETRELESKNLKHVLQKGDQIAVIIDDREEVWRQSIGNLLPAKPYDFFKGHGTSDCFILSISLAYASA